MLQDPNVERVIKNYTEPLQKQISMMQIELEALKQQCNIGAVSESEVFEHYGKPFTSGRDLWDFLTAHYNFTFKGKWYLIKKGDEYFAEKAVILPYSEIKKKVLLRDFNGDVISLGKDKEWAEQWIYDKNEIDGYL